MFIQRMKELNAGGALMGVVPETPAAEAAEVDSAEAEPLDITAIADMAREAQEVDTAAVEAEVPAAPTVEPIDWANLSPGATIQIPYAVMVKGTVTTLYAHLEELFVGTDRGLLYFNGERWALPGYDRHVVTPAETIDNLVAMGPYRDSTEAAAYRAVLMDINGLKSGDLVEGDTVRVYANAVASRINLVRRHGESLYLATARGMRRLEGSSQSLIRCQRTRHGSGQHDLYGCRR